MNVAYGKSQLAGIGGRAYDDCIEDFLKADIP
jgi:hypothetical protein